MTRPRQDLDNELLVENERRTEKPKLYKVLLHNDNFTTMEFVVAVLISIFNHSENSAVEIMLHIHHKGIGVAGVYSYEIAETKAAKVKTLAKEAQYPLLCTLEPE